MLALSMQEMPMLRPRDESQKRVLARGDVTIYERDRAYIAKNITYL